MQFACKTCDKPIAMLDTALYDVMNPETNPDHPEEAGPYCAECWPTTFTGQL